MEGDDDDVCGSDRSVIHCSHPAHHRSNAPVELSVIGWVLNVIWHDMCKIVRLWSRL